MRFLLGVLVGYSMRGKKKLLITVLATVVFIVFIILPAITLLALRLDVQHERQSRPAQTRVPSLKGLICHFSPDWLSIKLHNLARKLFTVTPWALLSLKRIPIAIVRNGTLLPT